MAKHEVGPVAEADLFEIWCYFWDETRSEELADRVVSTITTRFPLIAKHPYIGRNRKDDLRDGVRSYVAGDYVIYYRTDGENVVILRVFHGRRNPEELYGVEG